MLEQIQSPDKNQCTALKAHYPLEIAWVRLHTEGGKNWFRQLPLARSTARALHHCLDNRNAQILAWALCPNQLQLLIQAGSNCSITEAIQSLKVRTAIAANETAQSTIGLIGPLWQRQSHSQTVHQREFAHELGMQIIHRPQRLGLVDVYSDYPYWDCIWV